MAFDPATSFYADWTTISIAAASISIIGASMLIMMSRLFSLKHLEGIAKTEFSYAASTVLIVMVVSGGLIGFIEPQLASGSNSLARCMYLSSFNLCCDTPAQFPEQKTLIDWMKLYMATPTKCVQDFMSTLYVLSVPVEAIASIYMEIFMSEHASGFGIKWVAERITNTTQSLSFYMYIYYLLAHVLDFVKYYAGFFFSIGVALRAFPPTRGAGAYLMALSIGLYFVFPLSYILVSTMSLPHAQASILKPVDPGLAAAPTVPGGCQRIATSSFNYTCLLPQVSDIKSYACGGASVGRISEMPDLIRSNRDALSDMLSFRVTEFSRHLVSAICVFPLIALVIMFTFVLNTTNLFGGNIPEIGRGLVKLI